MNEYKFKPWSGIKKAEAQAFGEELERIEHKHRKVTPELVVRYASDKNNPMNQYFEWDDSVAAREYRLHQARLFINHIEIVRIDERKIEPIRAWVNTVSDDGHRYNSIVRVMSIDELREQVIAQALRELQAWTKRYERYQEFAVLVATINAEALSVSAKRRKGKAA